MSADVMEAMRSVRGWYHTIELAPDVVTPGWFDMRPVLARLPWPDVKGKRCLDIGTYDGSIAFELERRGAAEVVATDIADHADWDLLPRHAWKDAMVQEAFIGEKGRGFAVAKQALGSKVERRFIDIYDLSPETVGTFDVVVCGTLLLHLRDPLRALAAIRSVCRDAFLSVEEIDLTLSVLRRTPCTRLMGVQGQWHVPNAAGHRRMLDMAGFDVLETTRPFPRPFGTGHPPFRRTPRLRLHAAMMGGDGVPMSAALTRVAELGGPT